MSEKEGLHLARGFALPLSAVTQTLAILARKRSGKSYLARRLAEQLLRAGLQTVVVDPKGDYWGMRSSADGKSPGLSIIILGGEHGDIPLEVGGGEIVAKLVVEERASVLLDLSLFRKHEVATFMTAFSESLYRLKAREQYRTPVMLIVDEADAIAPQKPQHGEERMLGAMEDIVRRGGQRGIGCTFVTQRSAVLNKNVLTQAQVLVAMRTIAPQDLKAMDAWIEVHGTPEQRATLMESLPSLPQGDAWFWSPGWPEDEGIFRRVHVARIETFDSGATPAPGEQRVEPRKRAEIDLEALRRQMLETLERARADDPRELRREISALKKQLAAQVSAAPDPRALEAARTEAYTHGKINGMAVAQKALNALGAAVDRARAEISAEAESPDWRRPPAPGANGTPRRRNPLPPTRPADLVHGTMWPDKGKLAEGERRILTACAQYERGVTREQLTVLTAYKRSSRDTYLQRLQAKDYVRLGATITATPEGVAALGRAFEPLPTGDALREYWIRKLPEGERKILEVLIQAYPQTVTRDSLDDATGYKRSSRDTYIQRLRARQVVEVTGRGDLRASEEMFA